MPHNFLSFRALINGPAMILSSTESIAILKQNIETENLTEQGAN